MIGIMITILISLGGFVLSKPLSHTHTEMSTDHQFNSTLYQVDPEEIS